MSLYYTTKLVKTLLEDLIKQGVKQCSYSLLITHYANIYNIDKEQIGDAIHQQLLKATNDGWKAYIKSANVMLSYKQVYKRKKINFINYDKLAKKHSGL